MDSMSSSERHLMQVVRAAETACSSAKGPTGAAMGTGLVNAFVTDH